MKKVYTKPLAVMEDISLSENIAACDTNVSSSSANNASFSILDLAGFRHYFVADDNCENKIDDPDNPFIDGDTVYCYHTSVGTGSTSVFVFSS